MFDEEKWFLVEVLLEAWEKEEPNRRLFTSKNQYLIREKTAPVAGKKAVDIANQSVNDTNKGGNVRLNWIVVGPGDIYILGKELQDGMLASSVTHLDADAYTGNPVKS